MTVEEQFRKIIEVVVRCSDPRKCWRGILDIAGARDAPVPNDTTIREDIRAVTHQLQILLRHETPPADLTFLYFGLFDLAEGPTGEETIGFYVAGGTSVDPNDELSSGKLTYFPNARLLQTSVFGTIKKAGRLAARKKVFEYLLPFEAAGVIAKFVAEALNLSLAIYVGFDSGDYAQIR